jgi:hypothetical protein
MSLLALLGEASGANAFIERVGSAGELELGDEIFFVSWKQQRQPCMQELVFLSICLVGVC